MNDRIQSIHPLAPGQGGILFHAIGGGAPGDYVVQIVLDLDGTPDDAAEHAAWQALVARHDALRTAFVWKGQKQPLQVVGRRAVPRIGASDLTHLPPGDRAAHLAAWLERDRAEGFDLARAPLLRVHRFRLDETRHRMVVTFHHAALDGWSIPVLLREWVTLRAGQALPPALPFRDHVAWAHAQDRAAARAFWRAELAGCAAVPPFRLPAPDTPPSTRRGDLTLRLPVAEAQALAGAARGCGVTLATLIHGAWALFLTGSTGLPEAVYGLARAGRPVALKGAETRAGMFLTTLPMRATLDPDRPLSLWLAGLQARRIAQGAHEHLPLAEVLAAAGQRGAALMQTAVVIENYPTDPALLGQIPGMSIRAVEVLEQTGLGLTLYAMRREGLELRLLYDAAAISGAAARQVLDDLRGVLTAFSAHPDTPLREIAIRSRAETVIPAAPIPAQPGADLPALARIWQEILDIPPPAPGDNFFDLGGHSLLVIALQDRIRRDLGVGVEIPDLFRFATLAAQGGHIARLASGAAPNAVRSQAEARLTGAQRLRRRRAQTMTGERTDA